MVESTGLTVSLLACLWDGRFVSVLITNLILSAVFVACRAGSTAALSRSPRSVADSCQRCLHTSSQPVISVSVSSFPPFSVYKPRLLELNTCRYTDRWFCSGGNSHSAAGWARDAPADLLSARRAPLSIFSALSAPSLNLPFCSFFFFFIFLFNFTWIIWSKISGFRYLFWTFVLFLGLVRIFYP